MKKNVLFIHSFFRSGSTYIFHAFRRSENEYYCYQEPLNEFVVKAVSQPKKLLELEGSGEMQRLLRHPEIGRPYFAELYDTINNWKSLITPEITYDDYFGLSESHKINAYFNALIDASKRNNIVIQECRTGARIKPIKDTLGGNHITLWRNPWDQWWSSKSVEYFEIIPQVIASANDIPPIVKRVCDEYSIAILLGHSFEQQVRHFQQRWIKPDGSYALFFTLWCLNMLEGFKQADMLLSIDALSTSQTYRNSIAKQFTKMGFPDLDFSDCRIPQSFYTMTDVNFFRPIEEKIYTFLSEAGIDEMDILTLRNICQDNTRVLKDIKSLSVVERKYLKTVETLRSIVLVSQQSREREGVNSNTHISILNTQLIELKNDQEQSTKLKAEIQTLNAQLKTINIETHHQVSSYQRLLDKQTKIVGRLSKVAEAASTQNITISFDLKQAQSQLKNERKYNRFLQAEHESLLDFIQSYQMKTDAALCQQNKARIELEKSLETLSTQNREIHDAKIFREVELLMQIEQQEIAIQNLLNSTSWRITQPLRSIINIRTFMRHFSRARLMGLVAFIRAVPLSRVLTKKFIWVIPALKLKVGTLVNPKSLPVMKTTPWNLQLETKHVKTWISTLKKEEKT